MYTVPSSPRWGPRKPPLGAQLDQSHPLVLGLIGCWLLNESGGAIRSLVGNVPATSLGSGSAWSVGAHGPVLAFDGTTSQVVVPDILNDQALPSACTIDTWVYVAAGTSHGAFIKFGGSDITTGGDHGSGVAIGLGGSTLDDGGANIIALYENVAWKATSATIATQQWHHITGTFNGNSVVLYFDGVNVYSSATGSAYLTSTGSAPHGVVYLGGYHTANGPADRFAAHRQSMTRIWNRALTPSDIAQLHAEPYAMFQTVRPWIALFPYVAPPPMASLIQQRTYRASVR